MSLVTGVHVKAKTLKNFVDDQFDDPETIDLNKEAVDKLYDKLSASQESEFSIAFIETFSDVARMVDRGWDYETMRDETLDNLSEFDELRDYEGELIFTFALLLIDFLSIELDFKEIFTRPIEFITLFYNRFDITFG